MHQLKHPIVSIGHFFESEEVKNIKNLVSYKIGLGVGKMRKSPML